MNHTTRVQLHKTRGALQKLVDGKVAPSLVISEQLSLARHQQAEIDELRRRLDKMQGAK